MSPRPTLPADDLYARLEISVDASPEAIEVAWRSLLRTHHPDVAGPSGLEHAKRINVAHDWLSDPELRARYDEERGVRRSVRDSAGRDPRGGGRTSQNDGHDPRGDGREPGVDGRPMRQSIRRRPADPEEAMRRFLERVATLDADELDRMACAEPPPIAFGATIARFLPPDRLAALEAMESAIDALLVPAAAARPGIRDAVDGYATELVLGTFLDELLTEPFRDRARERLTRGWDAAVGQPRYGPNGVSIRALIARLEALDPGGVAALAATARKAGHAGGRDGEAPDPWPPGTSPDDDEALRVSSILAGRDASDAVPAAGVDRATLGRARWSAARLAHLIVLRHAFAPRTFASLTRPWRPRFLPDDERPATRVHRPGRR